MRYGIPTRLRTLGSIFTIIAVVGIASPTTGICTPCTPYFGTSESDGKVLAWFICLDIAHHSGTLYNPPGSTIDIKLAADPNSNTVSFHGIDHVGRKYQFKGKLVGRAFSGTMSVYDPLFPKDQRQREYSIAARAVPRGSRILQYSNSFFVHEDVEEMTGMDVFIILEPKRISGMVVFYQADWDNEPTFFPLALIDANKVEDELIFQLGWNGQGKTFRMSLSKSKASLAPTDLENQEKVTLMSKTVIPDNKCWRF